MVERKKNNSTSSNIGNFIKNDFRQHFSLRLNSELSIESYAGAKLLTPNPHLKFIDEKLDKHKNRLNLMYYFKSDMSGLYLALKVPYNNNLKRKYGNYYPIYLSNRSKYLRDFLEENNKLKEDFVFEMDLGSSITKQKFNKKSPVVAKYYDKYNIPSDEELISDINYFLELREFILNNYTERIEVTEDEWVSVLENKSVIDEKMFCILRLMFHMDDFSATTGQLNERRKRFGFTDEKSYNSTIVANSRRVKEFLNKNTVYNNDGTENFWMRFFYGKDVRIDKDKRAKAFQFTLKKDLIKAFARVDRTYSGEEVIINENLEDDEIIEVERVDDMVEEKLFNSFYDYLLYKEYFFDKETIENYLLSLKVKPFAILTGNSGTGKTKLSQLFAKYIANINDDIDDDSFDDLIENELVDFVDNSNEAKNEDFVPVKVTTAKSSWKVLTKGKEQNPGWTISNKCFVNYLPIAQIMDNYEIYVDGIKANASLIPVIQLYYKKSNKILKREFKKLNEQEEENKKLAIEKNLKHKKQFVNLDINVDSIKSLLNDDIKSFDDTIVIELPINNTAIEKRQWILSYEIFNYLPFNQSRVNCKIRYNDIYADAHIEIKFKFAYSKNDELMNYLKENQGIKDKVNVTIKGLNWNLDEFTPSWENIEELDGNKNVQLQIEEFSSEEDVQLIDEQIYENYKIIPVGANWTENRHIVGYYNVITNEYQDTPAYKLIEQANESSEPHFLILDEMNLSHVERYFADFLSAIESGEKIPLYGEEELTLPPNLFIVGTVNVDETTYMFSPKVLDRANVIEFETYSASDYMKGRINLNAPSGNISYLENPLAGNEIRSYGIDELRDLFEEVTVDGEPFWNLLTDEIYSFQKILKESGFDFGFRVINEIVRFMAVAWEYEGKPAEFKNWTRYFDACIKQKLLPKLHGSEKIIGETLDKLYAKSVGEHLTYETSKYPESAHKLHEMREVLRKQRYVSFIN